MRPVRSLHNRALALFALAAVAVLAAGCSGVSPSTAATVNGHGISRATVLRLLEDRTKLPDQTPLNGVGKGTFTSSAFADTLDRYVYDRILHQEAKRRRATITAADRAQARASLEQSAGAGQVRKIPKRLRDFVVEFNAAQVALQRSVAPKEDPAQREQQVVAAYNQQKTSLTNACISVIITPDKAGADAAAARVRAGEKFADVARQVSTDPTKEQGGAAGCQTLAQQPQLIAGDIATAKQGSLLGPYDLQGSFGLVEVTTLQTPTLDQARGQLEAALPAAGQAELQALVARLIAKADVEVNPRFGKWNRKAGKVDPPGGATPSTTAPTGAPAPDAAGAPSGAG